MPSDSLQTPLASTVAASLENAIAAAISRAQSIIDDGSVNPDGLLAEDPAVLAEALDAAQAFVGKLENIRRNLVLAALAAIDRKSEPESDDELHETDKRRRIFVFSGGGQPEQPDELHNEIGRAWNDAMRQLYAVRDLAHLLDVADDRAETVGYVIEREAERGVECMNALERLLVNARKQSRSSAEPDDDTSRAYARGMRDGLWHAHEALKGAERGLQIDRMNEDGSFPDPESGQ